MKKYFLAAKEILSSEFNDMFCGKSRFNLRSLHKIRRIKNCFFKPVFFFKSFLPGGNCIFYQIDKELEVLFLYFQSFLCQFPIFQPHHCIIRKKFQQGNLFAIMKLGFYIGNYGYMKQFSLAKLRFRIHDTDRIHFIAKQLNPVRFLISVRINIEYATTKSELTRFINKIRPIKTIIDQLLQ